MAAGGCFCGAVRFALNGPLTGVTYCHCSKCRRWHGHVGAYTAIDRADFVLTEQRGLKWHQLAADVRRGFCMECGSTLLWDQESLPKMGLTASSVDAPNQLQEKAHIYVGSKGAYYSVDGDLPKHETFPKR